jgi:hypothetical protein
MMTKKAILWALALATFSKAQSTNVTVNVNNDSALAERQRIEAENGRAIGEAIARGLLVGIQAAKIKQETKKATEWCTAHPGAEHGFHFSNGVNVSCDGGIVTFHEPDWKPPHIPEPIKPLTQDKSTPIPLDYVCLDEAVKATAPDGSTVFVSMQSKRGECESVVMPSTLSREDRDLLYKMSVDASNVSTFYMTDELREASGKERTWTPMIEMGVKNFRQMRTQLCSTHPDMFVYQLMDNGQRTAPRPCTQQ